MSLLQAVKQDKGETARESISSVEHRAANAPLLSVHENVLVAASRLLAVAHGREEPRGKSEGPRAVVLRGGFGMLLVRTLVVRSPFAPCSSRVGEAVEELCADTV